MSKRSIFSESKYHTLSYFDSWLRYVTLALFCANLLLLLWIVEGHHVLISEKSATGDKPCVRPQLTYSPASEHTSYLVKHLTRNLTNNPFVGLPREEHDRAWAKIIEPLVIVITPEEHARAQLDESVALADGEGFIAEMAVYHELHCIKQIRRHLHPTYYGVNFANMTAAQLDFETTHIDHCLEYWREAAMCRGDPTLTTFFWRNGIPTSHVYDRHECVDWDRLDSWARSRMFDVDRIDLLDQKDRKLAM